MPKSKLFDLSKPTAFLAIGLMLIILVMVLPVPAWVMDIGLTISCLLYTSPSPRDV